MLCCRVAVVDRGLLDGQPPAWNRLCSATGATGPHIYEPNDVIVLNANFETWQKRTSGLKVDPWLYYCIEQFVKPYNLSDEEVQYGDNGID